MQYIMTFFWSFLLISMVNYVVSSVMGAPFDFMTGVYISVVFSVLVFIVGAIIPNDPIPADDHHH